MSSTPASRERLPLPPPPLAPLFHGETAACAEPDPPGPPSGVPPTPPLRWPIIERTLSTISDPPMTPAADAAAVPRNEPPPPKPPPIGAAPGYCPPMGAPPAGPGPQPCCSCG